MLAYIIFVPVFFHISFEQASYCLPSELSDLLRNPVGYLYAEWWNKS
jgi:hypothetical protein